MREGAWPPRMGDLVPEYVSPEEREKKELEKEFNEVLKDKFALIPEGASFASTLKGVEKMTVVAPKTKDQAHVWLRFPSKDGRTRTETLTITKEGKLLGKVPPELEGVRKEDILREALSDLRALDLEFWVQTGMPVVPPGEWPARGEAVSGAEKESPKRPAVLNMDRLKFLKDQPGTIFGAIQEEKGFNDYHLFIFKDFAIMEHPADDNAAYFVDFKESLPDDVRRGTLKVEEKKAFVAKHSAEFQMSKREMRDKKFSFVVHQGEWKQRMREEIQKRQGGWSEMRA